MSTYASIANYQAYTDLTINTGSGALQKLLDNAERDVDRILQFRAALTDSIQGIAISNATSGTFIASVQWQLYTYTSAPIPYNIDGPGLICALNDMMDPLIDPYTGSGPWTYSPDDAYGEDDDDTDSNPSQIPAGSWIQPQGTFNDQYYAFGPFPQAPIVVEATGNMGGQVLSLLSFDTTELINSVEDGPEPTITVAQLVGGGLKIDPNQIEPYAALHLQNAVCAQAEYRDQQGPSFFAKAQWMSVSGPEFKTTGRLPMVGPRVFRELQDTDLIQRGARAAASTRANMALAYQPVGGVGIPDDWRAL